MQHAMLPKELQCVPGSRLIIHWTVQSSKITTKKMPKTTRKTKKTIKGIKKMKILKKKIMAKRVSRPPESRR